MKKLVVVVCVLATGCGAVSTEDDPNSESALMTTGSYREINDAQWQLANCLLDYEWPPFTPGSSMLDDCARETDNEAYWNIAANRKLSWWNLANQDTVARGAQAVDWCTGTRGNAMDARGCWFSVMFEFNCMDFPDENVNCKDWKPAPERIKDSYR